MLTRQQQRVPTPAPIIRTNNSAAVMRDVDLMAEYAMLSHAMLSKWVDTLAGADPILHDDLRFFLQVSKLSKAYVIQDFLERQ